MEGIGGFSSLLSKLLEIFKQKAYVFIEVNAHTEKPYVLTVMNRSGFDVLLNSIKVEPDGFPAEDNGWLLNKSRLFKNKRLKPGQRIRLFITAKELGKYEKRRFIINYSTYITENKLVPRLEQLCEHEFTPMEQTLSVVASAKIQFGFSSEGA